MSHLTPSNTSKTSPEIRRTETSQAAIFRFNHSMAWSDFSTATTVTGQFFFSASWAIEMARAPLPEPKSTMLTGALLDWFCIEIIFSISRRAASTKASLSGLGIKTP